MNNNVFDLNDDQFWDDSADIEATLVDRFEETDFLGLLIDGPESVRVDEHETVPLLGLRASSIRDNMALSLQRRAVVVSTHLEGHETLAATAFRQPDEPKRPSRPRDPNTLPKGRTVKAFSLSLTDRLPGFPWKPGTWKTTVLLYDQRSNSVVTRLEELPSQDPAVRDFLAAQRRPGFPAAISPPFDLEAANPYRPRPDSPAVPAEPGIVLATDRVAVLGARRSCVLRGSFRLPLLTRDLARPLPGAPGSETARQAFADGWVDIGDPSALAVVPITLLLTGDKNAEPILIPLQVPVYGPLQAEDNGQMAGGHFAIDLFRVVPDGLPIQSYAVWAQSRGILSAPVLLGIVSEAMIPAAGE